MDIEKYLVCKIVAEGDLTLAADGGITSSFFADEKHRAVFETILKHKTKYGQVPTLAVLKKDHPEYKFIKVEESYDYLVDQMRKRQKLRLLENALGNAVDAYESQDEERVLGILARAINEVAHVVPNMRDVDLTQNGEKRLTRYRELTDSVDELRGIPFGMPIIDRATQGAQPGQLVTLVGPPAAGKSTLGLLASMAAHAYGKRPLFVGFEMTNEEQEERFDAIRAAISHTRLRSGRLKAEEWQRLERSVHEMSNMQSFYVSADVQSVTTLTGLAAKIDSLQPDILIVDGVYMMDDELGEPKGSPQALTNITRGMKRMAMNAQIPILETTQVLEWKMSKKKGSQTVTTNSIGYSSSFVQDSDVVISVEKTDALERPNERKIKVIKSRHCPLIEVIVQWDWDNGTFEETTVDTEIEDGQRTW